MGTIWRKLGSVTHTKTRIDSSTLRSFDSSTERCCGVKAAGGDLRAEQRGEELTARPPSAKGGFQLPNTRNDPRVHERAEVLEAVRLVEQGAEFAQQLHIGFREYGYVGLRQDFQQRDFKRRQRNRSIEAVATLLPLASHTGMAKQKGCDQIGFVTIGAGIVAVAREVAQQRLGDLGIKVGLHPKSQHGGTARHV